MTNPVAILSKNGSISQLNNSRLEHSLKIMCTNVKIKAYLYELGINFSKLVETPLNVGLR